MSWPEDWCRYGDVDETITIEGKKIYLGDKKVPERKNQDEKNNDKVGDSK